MNTLHIKQLEFWGRHGITGDEKNIAQPFSVDVGVQYNFAPAIKSDRLSDAVDYKVIEKIVKEKVEGGSRVLIETLVNDIAEAIFEETESVSVDISLAKTRAKSTGIPSVTFTKIRQQELPTISKQLDLSAEKVKRFYSAETDGVLHIKGLLYSILDKEKIKQWYARKAETFEKKEEKYIQNNQQVSVVCNGPFGAMSAFDSIQETALHNLYYKIRHEINTYSDIPFKQGDRLESKLIKYPISALGVGAHKDLSSNINFIVVMNLYGTTTFYTSSDKKRSDEKAYIVEEGDIVIMRGPRNSTENDLRPIHYVLDILEERLVFVCREIEDATEAVINKGNWMGF
ncbi:MAG: dihydroneopterin aldolase [Candidatus Paceibacterota bacterium]